MQFPPDRTGLVWRAVFCCVFLVDAAGRSGVLRLPDEGGSAATFLAFGFAVSPDFSAGLLSVALLEESLVGGESCLAVGEIA